MAASPALLTKGQLAAITRRVHLSHERGDDAGPIAVDRRLLLQHIAALEQRVEAADKLAEGVDTVNRLRIGGAYGYVSDKISDAILSLESLARAYRALPKEPR